MGCTSSKEISEDLKPRQFPANRPVEDTTWVPEKGWSRTAELFSQYIADREDGRELALESREPGIVFASVRTWLGSHYRDCGLQGSIEDLDNYKLQVSGEGGRPELWPCKIIIVMDSCFSGEVVAVAFVAAVPVDENKPWLMPGDMANSKAVENVKEHLTFVLTNMEKSRDVFKSAEMMVFLGADAMRARWRPSITEPTITPVKEELNKSATKSIDQLRKSTRDVSQPMALYIPMALYALVSQLRSFAPEATVWDEGELPFAIGSSPYPFSTRLLVVRDEALRQQVEAMEYKINMPEGHPMSDAQPVFLWRNTNPDKDPGGIVAVCLAISVDSNAPWPKVGDYAKGPVPKAAADALLTLLKQWHRHGKVQRCVVKVDMGFDTLRYSFIGNKLEPEATVAAVGETPVVRKPTDDMSGFFVTLEEQRKHNLFDSEEHFQDIKTLMTNRMLNDPERYKKQALEAGRRSAAHFLEMNYPGKEVSFEAELPITFNGRTVETTLVVARHPAKKDKDIVAVVYCIPSPDGELMLDHAGKKKGWIGTPEAEAAVAALLGRMQQWQTEQRIAEDECMGQVMMGMDADVYLFKDGRFEDPSEERMGQINWG